MSESEAAALDNPYLARYLEIRERAQAAADPLGLRLFGGDFWFPATVDDHKFVHRRGEEFAFAVPSEEVIRRIAALSPVIEIGAGTGYWANLIAAAGGDIVAIDKAAPGANRFFDVRKGHAGSAYLHPDRALLLCWPPYATSMAFRAASAHLAAGGTRLVYIGENGGCTADDRFHNLLERRCNLTGVVRIPQWPGIHGYAFFYEAKAAAP